MKASQTILILVSIFSFSSCQPKEKKISQKAQEQVFTKPDSVKSDVPPCSYSNENDTLQESLFPFSFENYAIRKVLKYFAAGTIVDSSRLEQPGEDEYRIYTFHKQRSFISFQVKSNSPHFYLNECLIDNDLLKFNKDIQIGIPKREILKALDIKALNCDTLKFELGELSSYYTFIFRGNKLDKISILATE